MEKREQLGGLDYCKIVAALLVVMIHTSPLSSINSNADFILTRIIARVAVPFFFMVTGYFVLPQYLFQQSKDFQSLHRFMKKTSLLYIVAILIYLPINIYAGQFTGIRVLDLLRMLIFDGTFYYLWYLPASLLGVYVICRIGSKLSLKAWMCISIILYMIGLFGDSYYGVIAENEILRMVYNVMFSIFSYTRNGLFYAPIFLVMGVGMQQIRKPGKKNLILAGLIVSTGLMIAEGMTLHHFGLQRHDSMYLALLPCMFFLFQLMLSIKKAPKKSLRIISTWIYIIHPIMIIVVRGAAKVLHLEALLIDNSLLHYIAVCIASGCFAILLEWFMTRKKEKVIL